MLELVTLFILRRSEVDGTSIFDFDQETTRNNKLPLLITCYYTFNIF